ncbi:MAG: diacylglycerol kinase family protein [Eubacteriales bacterium]|nr:diacylglycerol kinase family protein [Eubacteriales bacterium]
MKYYFIINPISGNDYKKIELEEKIKNYFYDCNYTIYRTKCESDATRYVESIIQEEDINEEKRFIACGGDGTISEVATGLINSKNTSLAILPCGTGNDYIKYFGKKEDFLSKKYLENIKVKKTIAVDICKVKYNDIIFYSMNVINFGFDATVCDIMNKIKKYPIIGGKNAYYSGIIIALFHSIITKSEIIIDGEIFFNDSLILCTIANGSFVGGSFKCAPKSKNDDNLLEVCIIKPFSRLLFPKMMPIYIKGEHLESKIMKKYVLYKRANKITIINHNKNSNAMLFTIDGNMHKANKLELTNYNKAINFVSI